MRCLDPLWRILLFTLLALACLPAQAARDVAATRECSICHIAWVPDFKRNDVTPLTPFEPRPVMPSGRQDVVSNERMCWSCHDGFMLDARLKWAGRGHSHPVGVVPSNKVKIPMREGKNQFPLNDDGKVYCGTCHSAHGVDWAGNSRSPIFLRLQNVNSSLCVACHLERSTGPQEGNHPVFKEVKERPAPLVAAGSKFTEKNEVICESCHRIHGAADRKILAVQNDSSQLCGTCHSDRYAKDLSQAGRMGTHPVNIKPIKAVVAQSLIDAGAHLSPAGNIICQTCHKPHFAEHNARILVQRNPKSQLCQTCHETQRRVADSKHNLALLDPTIKNVRDQPVEETGVCSGCHLPHGGQGPKMWARPIVKAGEEPMADLCLSCHREGGPAEKKQVGRFSHPVGRDMNRLGHTVDLPAYTREGVKSVGGTQGAVTCASCHDPHQWDPLKPEATSKPGDPSDTSNKFLRKPHTSDSALCQTCHKDKDGVRNTKHDLALMAPNERNAEGRLATEAGVCGNCHLPHNGKGVRMWAREVKPGVDPVSSTCFSCHDAKGLAKDKLVGAYSHPVDAPIARIGITAKAGEWIGDIGAKHKPLPLYDSVGIKSPEGGNVTCGTCHDPHNWSSGPNPDVGKPPKDVKGSGQTRFLRMPYDDKGTLCANCHVDQGSIYLSKHNLAISAPGEKNILGLSAGEISVCANCHLPHNGRGAKMWARESNGTGHDEIEKRCTDCHREGGVAKKKLTGANSHPIAVDLKNVGGETTLPLYTAEGRRDQEKGKVSCATCHNLHRWKAADPASKSGADAKVEGTAADSFLRKPAAPNPELCADCHRDKRWVKNTEHDLDVTVPDATNINGETTRQSGVCGQCHTPHNATQPFRLWARDLGPGGDPMEKLCRSCHSDNRIAANKQPFKSNHPAKVPALSTAGRQRPGQEVPGYFPVYDAKGKAGSVGQITCPTCHNPHQWSAAEQAEGPGKNTEGDARNSFLRNSSDFGICADCHGLDALFRYKYFHGEASRVKHKLFR